MVTAVLRRTLDSQLAHNVRILLAGTATVQLVGLLTLPVLTRLYGPGEIGIWSLYFACVLSVGALAGLRLDLAFFMTDESRAAEITKATTVAALLSTTGVGAVLVFGGLISGSFFGLGPVALVMLAANIAVFSLFQVLQYRMNRAQQFRPMARIRMAQAVTTSLTQVTLGLTGMGTLGLLAGTLTGHLLPLLVHLPRLLEGFGTVEPGAFRRVVREFWKLPILNGAAALADAVRLNGLNFIVAAVYSAHWLGMYSMAWRVVVAPSGLLSGVLAQVYLPRFTAHRTCGLRRQVLQCGALAAAVGILPFAILRIWGEQLFGFALGPEWIAAGTVASNLTPYLYMSFIASPLSNVFIVTNRQGTALFFSVVYALVPLALVWFCSDDFLQTTRVLGMVMAVLLMVNLGLVYRASSPRRPEIDRSEPG